MLNDTPQWVALYTNPRAEKKAEQRLREMGYTTYLPLQEKLHRWSDRWKKVDVPLFSSYIFAKICRKDVVPVRGAEGISFIISWGNEPAIVPDNEIEAVRRVVDASVALSVMNTSQLKKGQKVRIVDGQFAGLEGMLISDCEGGNFCISITGLNVALVMQIEQALLEPVQEQKKRRRGGWDK